MNKTVLLVAFLIVPIFSQSDNFPWDRLYFFYSVNAINKAHLSNSGHTTTYEADPSSMLGLELYGIKEKGGMSLGLGAEYQFSGNIPGKEGHFNNIPIYFFYEILLSETHPVVPNIIMQIGLNFLKTSDNFITPGSASKEGIYYAIGFGSQWNDNFRIKLLYAVSQGKISMESRDYLFINNKVNIGFYFAFDIIIKSS